MMKFLRIITAAAALAVFAAGCESFKSDDSGKTKKSEKAKKSGSRSKRKRDPYNDMFFGLDGAKAQSFSRDSLSEREQKLLDDELREQDEEMRELKRMHRDMDPNRSKRKEWVYGFKPLGSDK